MPSSGATRPMVASLRSRVRRTMPGRHTAKKSKTAVMVAASHWRLGAGKIGLPGCRRNVAWRPQSPLMSGALCARVGYITRRTGGGARPQRGDGKMVNTGIREAVGVFHDERSLQAAVDALLIAGFDRSHLSLLAGQGSIEAKLGHRFEK